jgi:hypothetical protein
VGRWVRVSDVCRCFSSNGQRVLDVMSTCSVGVDSRIRDPSSRYSGYGYRCDQLI